jgi:hypothetical protein
VAWPDRIVGGRRRARRLEFGLPHRLAVIEVDESGVMQRASLPLPSRDGRISKPMRFA